MVQVADSNHCWASNRLKISVKQAANWYTFFKSGNDKGIERRCSYGTPVETFLFQYLPEKKLKQKRI